MNAKRINISRVDADRIESAMIESGIKSRIVGRADPYVIDSCRFAPGSELYRVIGSFFDPMYQFAFGQFFEPWRPSAVELFCDLGQHIVVFIVRLSEDNGDSVVSMVAM